MPESSFKASVKHAVNWDPRSEMIFFGKLWFFQTWSRNSFAQPSADNLVYVGMK